jgi:hypothetical protein
MLARSATFGSPASPLSIKEAKCRAVPGRGQGAGPQPRTVYPSPLVRKEVANLMVRTAPKPTTQKMCMQSLGPGVGLEPAIVSTTISCSPRGN